MRKVALTVAAILVLAVVSPAFSQPFADVPTDHWAFDAIAELAAKGLIEGYPDGTFKGDRAMTRYEIAMVVARLLARIEAIKIPAPPPATKIDVSRADITTLQRLINEFRAELAALGVRVTAVEEELAALRARVDNTRVTGDLLIEYYSPLGVAGVPEILSRQRLQFTGVTGAFTVVGRVALGDDGNGTYTWGSFGAGTMGNLNPEFDLAYVDWSAGPFGTNWRVGRQRFTLGPTGLLFNTTETTGDAFDGARVNWGLGPVALTIAAFLDPVNADDIWSISAGFGLLPGFTTRVHYYTERPNPTGTPANTGWELELAGGLLSGVSFSLDYATYTPSGGSANTALRAGVVIDLGGITGMTTFAPKLEIAYKDYGNGGVCTPNATCPSWSNAETSVFAANTYDLRSTYARLDLTFSSTVSGYLSYETGTVKSSGAAVTEYEVGTSLALGGNSALDIYYDYRTLAGTVAAGTGIYVDFTTSW